ncbi:MAG: DNA-binding protein YbiB, partial [Rhodoferax sp.]|nr:DNA-binding protein YbiB [Rhodoferax sp.]
VLHPGLQRLLDVRRVLQLRNPAHSLVKLLLPCQGQQVLVTSYTHPEYALTMEAVLCKRQTTALLLRGTEGEAVADPRRLPRMVSIVRGTRTVLEPQSGPLTSLPLLPRDCSVDSTVRYIDSVLRGKVPVPQPIVLQLERIVELALGG